MFYLSLFIHLIKSTDTISIILFTWNLDHITIVINIFALLLEDESLKEFCQNPVCSKEFNNASVGLLGQNFGHKISRDLLWLGSKDAEWEFAELWCGIVEKKLGKDHSRRQAVNLNSSLRLLLGITLNTLVNFLHETRSQLWQTPLRGTIGSVSRRSTSLDAASHGIENMSSKSILLGHDIHRHLGTVEDPQKIHLHNGLDLTHRQFRQSASSAINTGIIDPITNVAQFLLSEFAELLARGGIRHVARCVVNLAVGMTRRERLGSHGAVLDVTDDDVVASVHEFARVGESDSAGRSGNDDSSVGHGVQR
mmetsp:Transcript_44090/g.92735  ORF Transcript_44090/g.92735 Transcript_44090/m.92735 type:complete len:309 (+) Transcript_44090:1459-2385(+)